MVLEAMAAGIAVVVTRVGGLPELIGYGRCGICVPPLDVKALADALTRLIENDALRADLGAKAHCEAQVRHDPTAVGSAWLHVLREAAGSPAHDPIGDPETSSLNVASHRLDLSGV